MQQAQDFLIVADATERPLVFVYPAPFAGPIATNTEPSGRDAETLAAAIAQLPNLTSPQGKERQLALPTTVPAPWSVRDFAAALLVSAQNGLQVAWVYVDDPKAGQLPYDAARQIAEEIAHLPRR